jgi:hypothetical protein
VLVDSDYSDYSFFYDTYYTDYCTADPANCFEWGAQFVNDSGNLINPSQFIHGTDGYTMQSHELRIASPKDNRFRVVAGLFWQDFEHEIFQRYQINDLATSISVPLWDDTIWLTNQLREDQSQAVFGEVAYDFTAKLTGTAGIRYYEYDNSLRGFFGFNENYYDAYGTALCFSSVQYNGSPCTNLDATSTTPAVPKFNLTYRFDDDSSWRDVLRGLPPGWREPQRRLAVRCGLPEELRNRLEDDLGRRARPRERRRVPRGMGRHPVRLSPARRRWPDRDPQRRCRGDRRHRGRRGLGADGCNDHHRRIHLARRGAVQGLLRGSGGSARGVQGRSPAGDA